MFSPSVVHSPCGIRLTSAKDKPKAEKPQGGSPPPTQGKPLKKSLGDRKR